jgi:DNA polymerase-3 subunit delta'
VSWQRVRGHEPLVRTFAEIVRRSRLGHAYLLAGPRGVGKKLFAAELAKTLLCERAGGSFEPCDRCPSCLQVAAGTHPDLILAARPDEKVEFPIEVIREVGAKLALKPARGGFKIAIIDDADDFNDEAANAFLKTLEEPPPRSLILLIATDPERQLATIQSRCQLVRFAPLPPAVIAGLLQKQAMEPAQAERLARISGGSLGQAVELSDPELWNFRGALLAELAKAKPDSVRLAKKWFEFVEEAGKEAGAQRRRAALTIRLLVDVLNQALRTSAGAELENVADEDRDAVRALADRLGTEKLMRLIDRCLVADHQIDRKVQLVLIVEALADSLA